MSEIKITDSLLLEELEKRFKEKGKAINELQSLTDELKVVNEKLAKSEQLKSNFIANINNEIINPFASVLGLSRSILDIKENDWDRVMYMAKLIFVEAHNLDFQLKNIFSAAEIEAGSVHIQVSNVDVVQVIKGVVEEFSNDLKSKSLQIVFNDETTVDDDKVFTFKTDAEKFKLIVSNLLSNAIKFSKGADIVINVKTIEDKLQVSVRDFGIGISKHNKELIFDRFTRLDTGINSVNRGHGLGLSVIKAFIELFEGHINFESELGKGSLFTVTIPEPDKNLDIDGFSSEGNEIFFGDDDGIF